MSGLDTCRGAQIQQNSAYVRSVLSIERSSTVDTYIISRGHLGQSSLEQSHNSDHGILFPNVILSSLDKSTMQLSPAFKIIGIKGARLLFGFS